MKTTIDMAREAGDEEWKILIKQVIKHFPDEIERFVDLVRADEREACAKVADGYIGCDPIADAIRARGNT